jgi:hypothetical protein
MSMTWKYNGNGNGKIDTIYCSHIKMQIPLEYYWTVLLKDGSEYDLANPVLITILKDKEDLDALSKARANYLKIKSVISHDTVHT